MKNCPREQTLALYATGDLDWRDRWVTAWHLRSCPRCAEAAQAYRDDVAFRRTTAESMPLPSNWEALAEEMAANIRLGLEASDCIRDVATSPAPVVVRRKPEPAVRPNWFWKPAAAIATGMAGVVIAWVSLMPPEASQVFSNVWNAAVYGKHLPVKNAGTFDNMVLESSSSGIELRRGSRQSMKVLVTGLKPEQISANFDGSLRAQYVDEDSGQVTVTDVYSQ